MKKACLSDPAESIPESCPVKICPVKPFPTEKVGNGYLTFRSILHNLAHSVKILNSVKMLNFWYSMAIL